MLAKYKNIIYKDENAEKKVIDYCTKYVVNLYPDVDPHKIEKSIQDKENNAINQDYAFVLLQSEGRLLFNITAEKFGMALWKNQAWEKSDCFKKCPFGNMCKKYLVQIDMEKLCYGQLISRNICEKELVILSKTCNIKILKPNNEIYLDLDLNSNNYDNQLLSGYFLLTSGLYGGLAIMAE